MSWFHIALGRNSTFFLLFRLRFVPSCFCPFRHGPDDHVTLCTLPFMEILIKGMCSLDAMRRGQKEGKNEEGTKGLKDGFPDYWEKTQSCFDY